MPGITLVESMEAVIRLIIIHAVRRPRTFRHKELFSRPASSFEKVLLRRQFF